MSLAKFFIPKHQLSFIKELSKGEEGQFFIDKMKELEKIFETMPKVYEQDGKGNEAVAYLHYFGNGWHWYITERDTSNEQIQAFGLVYGFERELGYISINEMLNIGAVEIDLHFTPKTLREIKKEQG